MQKFKIPGVHEAKLELEVKQEGVPVTELLLLCFSIQVLDSYNNQPQKPGMSMMTACWNLWDTSSVPWTHSHVRFSFWGGINSSVMALCEIKLNNFFGVFCPLHKKAAPLIGSL